MPPKSGAGDKKKLEAEEFELQEKLKQAAARIESLEREILMKTEENARLVSEIRIFEAQVKQLSSDIERERADRHDVAVDMTRQFKSMQDELLKDIADRERGIEVVRAQNAKEKIQLESDLRERDELIQRKDNEILDLKNRLDQLSREFSAILRETLDTISEKIENRTDELTLQ
ncbi:hypothetical protein QR46_4784 [Giardia duodenalis assemblage B]|uniref:Dynein regulatory complex protein 12 n=3 Tax=Giardia intestinalis TaxID=5741 RepID=A0A132NMJ8_GIAIN|nr:Hypothetical protein GL50581_2845 [Giardia intestinalis ATCC 50581]ESU42585.1 Hypothetical protein GSB_3419 [Giardia intestinalis]KWX11261.1 hypothetical protein QR46_4784 [Giardia intestinalis assemblage B]